MKNLQIGFDKLVGKVLINYYVMQSQQLEKYIDLIRVFLFLTTAALLVSMLTSACNLTPACMIQVPVINWHLYKKFQEKHTGKKD